MPGKVKVKIMAGRNLPVMDRSSDTTDAYVEIKLGSVTYKTDVCRKSLNPQWNSEWYRFEVDDAELQDEPLQIRLMDHDTYSANDAIGKVYIDLNPLLLSSSGLLPKVGYDQNSSHENITNSVMSGWFPVYDTMHGIRGEVNVTVKVELFTDFNKFKQSSCGVQFFCSSIIPHGYSVKVIHGFVEELVVNDDPEYKWIDKIRTPRASNEARQVLFLKLSGELQRKIGVKALELGGNAVVGYSQSFDFEGESGIVARGIGTAVSLIKIRDYFHPPTPQPTTETTDDRALNYLKFLGSSNNFYLKKNPERHHPKQSILPLTPISPITISENVLCDKEFVFQRPIYTRHRSTIEFPFEQSVRSASSMQSLLKQEDFRRNPSRGISQTFRNLKYASHFMLSKKMSAIRARISETDENCPLWESNSSPALIQNGDLKNKKQKIYKRSTSESSVMAEYLINSLIRSSLECIKEIGNNSVPDANEKELESYIDIDAGSGDVSEKETSSESTDSEDESYSKEKSVDYETVSSIIKNIETIERRESIESNKSDTSEIFNNSTEFMEEKQKFEKENEYLCESDKKEIIQFFQDDSFSIPPLAEPEDFSVQEDNPQILLHSSNKHRNSEINFKNKVKSKFFMPPIQIGEDIERKSLVQTAMQAMLLEKVNIIGTYTPPLSPALDEDEDSDKDEIGNSLPSPKVTHLNANVNSVASSSCSLETESFYPQISKTFEILRRSPTALSLIEHYTEDKITPAGFTSLDNLNKNAPLEHKKKKSKLKSFENILHQKSLTVKQLLKEKISNLLNPKKRSIDNNESAKNKSKPQFPVPTKTITDTNFASQTPLDVKSNKTSDKVNSNKSFNVKIHDYVNSSFNTLHASLTLANRTSETLIPDTNRPDQGHQRAESTGSKVAAHSPVKFVPGTSGLRRSSDSDLSITPKGNSFTGSDKSGGISSNVFKPGTLMRSNIPQDNFDMLEYPFLTISRYPSGGAVSARSVKLLERISNLDEPESRDTWWSELRMEIRSHAKTLNCNAVLGYSEATSICDDICILSATGTAAVINYHCLGDGDAYSGIPFIPKTYNKENLVSSLEKNDSEGPVAGKQTLESPEHDINNLIGFCNLCHAPYSGNTVPLRKTTFRCGVCKNAKVPDILITTVELPEEMLASGKGCLLQAHVRRQLKDLRGESNAKDISDGLPFLEYELHRLLVNKLRIKGMNAIFGLKIRISVGVRVLIGVATGTAVFLLPLPPSLPPKLVSDNSTSSKKLAEMQKLLNETVKKNKEIYQIKSEESVNGRTFSDNEEEGADSPRLDLATENRDCCILEADDPEDIELMNLLVEPQPPDGFHVVNLEQVPGLMELEIVKNLQMFIQVWRGKLNTPFNLAKVLQKLLQTIYFKLRRMIPCALCDVQFRIDLPDSDDIQIVILGMALGLAELNVKTKVKNNVLNKETTKSDDEFLIFNMEELPSVETGHASNALQPSTSKFKHKQKLPERESFVQKMMKGKCGVDITPLTYIPGGKIEKYLGNLNFFFIRETTSIREEGGLSGFIHSFTTEVLTVVRAHVTALGGNAMVAFYMNECVVYHNLHKNQGQCLINVGGDVVIVLYSHED